MEMKKEAWIVVADDAYARIFKLDKRHLQEIKTLVHPESRLHERDLISDKPGRSFESHTSTRRAVSPPVSQKKHEAEIFAKFVADFLENAVSDGHIDRIYLAASPNFLGLLRQSMSKLISRLIVCEINKNITHLNSNEIETFFPFAEG